MKRGMLWAVGVVVVLAAGCSADVDVYTAPIAATPTDEPLVFDGGPSGDVTANGYRCTLSVFADDLEWRHLLCDFNGLQADYLDEFGDAIGDEQANRAGTAQLMYPTDRASSIVEMVAVNEHLFAEINPPG